MDEMDYIYLGDRLTRPELRRMPCRAVRRSDGKCIRGRNGNMLVELAAWVNALFWGDYCGK